MKKIFLLIFLGGLFIPLIILAVGGSYTVEDYVCGDPPATYSVSYEGLVPCGRCLPVDPPAPAAWDDECGVPTTECANTDVRYIKCTSCHFFIMIDGIIDFILLTVIPPIGTLILIISGIAFYQAGSNPEKFKWAKSVLISAIIGLAIVYTSWIIVNSTLNAIGIADWVGFGEGWFQITCDVKYWKN